VFSSRVYKTFIIRRRKSSSKGVAPTSKIRPSTWSFITAVTSFKTSTKMCSQDYVPSVYTKQHRYTAIGKTVTSDNIEQWNFVAIGYKINTERQFTCLINSDYFVITTNLFILPHYISWFSAARCHEPLTTQAIYA